MGRHKRGKQRKRDYRHARTLGHPLDDEAAARELAFFDLLPADDETSEETEPPSPAALVWPRPSCTSRWRPASR